MRSVLSENKPRGGNEQRDSIELVEWRPKNLSNKTRLNILRAKNARCRGARPNIERNNKIAGDLENKVGKGQETEVERGNKQIEDPKRDDKEVGDPR